MCASPYVLALSSEGFEIRLLINGNLVHTAGIMPNMSLITLKTDIFFATTAPEYYNGSHPTATTPKEVLPSTSSQHRENTSGPSSPNCMSFYFAVTNVYDTFTHISF